MTKDTAFKFVRTFRSIGHYFKNMIAHSVELEILFFLKKKKRRHQKKNRKPTNNQEFKAPR